MDWMILLHSSRRRGVQHGVLWVYRWQSLVASFVYVDCGLVKIELNAKCDAKVFKTVNYLDWLMVDRYVVLRWGTEFFGSGNIEVEMVVLTPLGKVCDGVVVVLSGVIVWEESKNGSVVWVLEIGGGGWWACAVIGVEYVEEGAQYTALWCSDVCGEYGWCG